MLNFNEFTDDDYDTFQGMEPSDKPVIAEVHGKLDDKEVTFVIIAVPYALYIEVYARIVNDVDTDHLCEFLKMTSEPTKETGYKGVSYAQLFDWQNLSSEHLQNIGFELINYKE